MKTTLTAKIAICDAKSYVDYSKKRLALARKNAKKTTATVDLINRRLDGIGDEDSSIAIWPELNVWNNEVKLAVSISVTTDSMLEGVVPQILKAMLDMECEATASKDTVTDIEALRHFDFSRPESEHFLAMTIGVDVNIRETDTGTCKKVQIGTKMVEVAGYKLECIGE